MIERELVGAIGRALRPEDEDDLVAVRPRPAPTKLTTAELAELPASAREGIEPGKLTYDDVEFDRPKAKARAPRPGHGARIYRDGHGDAPDDHPAVRAALARRGNGQPLPDTLRATMESRFRASFAQVRIHTDPVAAEASRAISANAFTVGQDIFFADGQVGSDALLAHELTHVVQAQQGRTASAGMSRHDDSLEHEARAVGSRVAGGAEAGMAAPSAPVGSGRGGAILRDSAPRSDLTADMVTVSSFNLTNAGAVTATRAGAQVSIESPEIRFDATVDLASGVTLTPDPMLEVGPVQTINGSQRVGVYRRPDQSTFESVMSITGAHRDAMWTNRGNTTVASYPEPWYGAPQRLSSGSVTVSFMDKPGFELALNDTGGTLVQIRGSESFATSVAAKRGATLLHLQNLQWSVPWAMAIEPGGTGTGGGLGGQMGGPAPSVTTGTIAVNAVDEYMRFESVADAKAFGWRRLLDMIVGARQNDARAAGFIAQALTELNPQFHVQLKCDNCYAMLGNDAVTLYTIGMGSTSAQMSLDTGDVGNDVTNFTTVLDANQLHSGSTVTFAGQVGDHRFQKQYFYPFADASSSWHAMEGSDGRYTMKVHLA